jgi:hypothetical protein
MIVLALINMLLLLVGFLPALRKKSPAANRGMAGHAPANRACIE